MYIAGLTVELKAKITFYVKQIWNFQTELTLTCSGTHSDTLSPFILELCVYVKFATHACTHNHDYLHFWSVYNLNHVIKEHRGFQAVASFLSLYVAIIFLISAIALPGFKPWKKQQRNRFFIDSMTVFCFIGISTTLKYTQIGCDLIQYRFVMIRMN